MSPRSDMIYFIEAPAHGLIKAGISHSPESRLRSLMMWSPVELSLLATVPGDLADEKAIHYRFREDWSHFEWFIASTCLREFIARVARTQLLPSELHCVAVPTGWRLPHQRQRGTRAKSFAAGRRTYAPVSQGGRA